MKKQRSFTLIELLVVITIIGILASLVIVGTKAARDKAKRTAILQFASQVHHSLGAYALGIWDFDDQIFPTKDSSGYGNDMSCTSCPGWVSGGDNTPTGQGFALSFNGTNNYLSKSSFNKLLSNEITIGFWMKSTDTSARPITYYSAPWSEFRIAFTTSNLSVYITGKTGESGATQCAPIANTATVNINVSDGLWHYIVVSWRRSDGQIKIHIDGKEYSPSPTAIAQECYLRVGCLAVGGQTNADCSIITTYYEGFIEEVRIYEQTLVSAQVQRLYVEGVGRHQNLAKTE